MLNILSKLSITIIKTSSSLVRRNLSTMHSNIITKDYKQFKVVVLPALSDNFMYLLIDKSTKEAAIVDPVAPDVVWEAVRKENVKLTTILTTHHHWDHAGGNKELIESNNNSQLTVVGGDDRIYGLSFMPVPNEYDFNMGSLHIKILRTPCHTTGHVCYLVCSRNDEVVFTGDTLFLGGCGRFFEGTAEQMYKALIKTLSTLPDNTDVYCGHEYAIQNLKFGLRVEPHNQDIILLLNEIETKRKIKDPSVPSTIGLEKRINPFMRVEKEPVQTFTQSIGDPIKTMELLRNIKNQS